MVDQEKKGLKESIIFRWREYTGYLNKGINILILLYNTDKL